MRFKYHCWTIEFNLLIGQCIRFQWRVYEFGRVVATGCANDTQEAVDNAKYWCDSQIPF